MEEKIKTKRGGACHKTGRTQQLGLCVSIEFRRKVRELAAREKMPINALIEKAVELYENQTR